MFLAYLAAILYISVFYDTHYFNSVTILVPLPEKVSSSYRANIFFSVKKPWVPGWQQGFFYA
jgi:hypothetical protein